MKAEFDGVARQYEAQHRANIGLSGEEPRFFAEYKIAELARTLRPGRPPRRILDFGSGIGNSIPFFRHYFPGARLTCADVSAESITLSRDTHQGGEEYIWIDDRVPCDDETFDVVFSACVFHHIPHERHDHWLQELRRVTRPGGRLVIFEHNPFNPFTRHAVNTCPFDANAELITARKLRRAGRRAGWRARATPLPCLFPTQIAGLAGAGSMAGVGSHRSAVLA